MAIEDQCDGATAVDVDYVGALLDQNRLLGELIRDADLVTPVPSCPGWTLGQLLRHVGRGDRWAAQMISDRATTVLDPQQVRDGKPPSDVDGAVEWLHGSARSVIDAVDEAGPDTPIWTFIGPRPSAWWIRRRLHEATVHRADAALALGVDYRLDDSLAADGISEWLDLVAARSPASDPMPLAEGLVLHLYATDEGLGVTGEWTVRGSGNAVSWEHGHRKGTVTLRGPSTDLLLTITGRRTADESGVQILGDGSVWNNWLERTSF
jgi:uncharacterized protein (TIGR03083 family)